MRIAFGILLYLFFLVNGCASVQPDLWPPAAGERTYPIYVSLDTWHGMIGFPAGADAESSLHNPGSGDNRLREQEPHGSYEEWGFAELRWYVEERQGFTGAMRALFWPTAGTVEVGRYDGLWASRTPQPPADLFLFHLSHEGFIRLRRYLLSTAEGDEPVASFNQSVFYPSRRSYHLFYHCHHYLAHALREAGLPIAPYLGLSRTLLAMQLRRAGRMVAEPAAAEAAEK